MRSSGVHGIVPIRSTSLSFVHCRPFSLVVFRRAPMDGPLTDGRTYRQLNLNTGNESIGSNYW